MVLKPCPEIQAGPGHVVLSTFAHPATHEILDVTIGQGEDVETIGVTETHPFWSVQDQAFVPIGHLLAGSQVLTADEQTKTITSILPRPGPAQQVYNLEVNGEHVYYVGQQQLLAHNNCLITGRGRTHITYRGYKNGMPYTGYANAATSEGLDAYSILGRRYQSDGGINSVFDQMPEIIFVGTDEIGKQTARGLENAVFWKDVEDYGFANVANTQSPVGLNNPRRQLYESAASNWFFERGDSWYWWN